MADVSHSQIGILPCPGGMAFAQKIFDHLKTITREKLEERVANLSKSYKLPRAEIIRQVNLAEDILPSSGDLDEPIDRQRSPTYLVPAKFTRFPNGEFKTEILTSVRDTEIYIVQDVSNRYPLQFQKSDDPQCLSVNDHIFCLLVTVDAALQAGAMQVTVILPTFPYSRQHKKKGRESLSAARVGQMLEAYGVTRIITLDIHSKEIENCFNHLRLENLHGAYQILKVLASVTDLKDESLVVVAPDTGAVDRNKFYASILGKPLGMLYKERDYSRVAQSAENGNITDMKLLGSVEGKTVFMIDDMIGTGGTLIKAMRKLKEFGARKNRLRGEPAPVQRPGRRNLRRSLPGRPLFTHHRNQRGLPRRISPEQGVVPERRRHPPVREDHLPAPLQQEPELPPGRQERDQGSLEEVLMMRSSSRSMSARSSCRVRRRSR